MDTESELLTCRDKYKVQMFRIQIFQALQLFD
jgi:hypothetical protein